MAVLAGVSCDVVILAGVSCDVVVLAGVSCDVAVLVGVSCDVVVLAGVSCDVAVLVGVSCDVVVLAGVSCDVAVLVGVSCDVAVLAGVCCDVAVLAGVCRDGAVLATSVCRTVAEFVVATDVAGVSVECIVSSAAVGDVTSVTVALCELRFCRDDVPVPVVAVEDVGCLVETTGGSVVSIVSTAGSLDSTNCL